ERQRDHHVVGIGIDVGSSCGFDLPRIGGERLVDGIVPDRRGTGGNQGGTGYDAPDADRTLEQYPKHLQKVIGGPRNPVKDRAAKAQRKTSLRLIKNIKTVSR